MLVRDCGLRRTTKFSSFACSKSAGDLCRAVASVVILGAYCRAIIAAVPSVGGSVELGIGTTGA
jgi:hypothetical protein